MTFEPLTPDRRRAMTRQHLLDAAAIVFARNGFHGSTLDEVAATAGFSKGAVYSNFKSKDDLFVAVLDDRIERQFAVVSEVLDTGSHDAAEQFPRIREIFRSDMFWSDDFLTLWLEFVLYARRNPEAQRKLAASAQRSHARVQQLIEHEYTMVGVSPSYPTSDLAVTDQMLDSTLAFLYDAMGVEDSAVDDRRTPQSTR